MQEEPVACEFALSSFLLYFSPKWLQVSHRTHTAPWPFPSFPWLTFLEAGLSQAQEGISSSLSSNGEPVLCSSVTGKAMAVFFCPDMAEGQYHLGSRDSDLKDTAPGPWDQWSWPMPGAGGEHSSCAWLSKGYPTLCNWAGGRRKELNLC